MIVMYDSIELDTIPASAAAVAGYVGGQWPTFGALAKRWPRAHLLSIAISASEDATCLDIERGDATIEQAPAWWARQHHRGVWRPVLYTSLSNAKDLTDHLTENQIGRGFYRLWVAHYTDEPHLEPGSDATQWTDKALGRNLDESLCVPEFFGALPPSGAAVAAARAEEASEYNQGFQAGFAAGWKSARD